MLTNFSFSDIYQATTGESLRDTMPTHLEISKENMGQIKEIDLTHWASLSVPDVYFTYEYYKISQIVEPNVSRIVLLEWADDNGTIRLPLILRSIEQTGYFDATSAYGYGGPWIEGDPDLSFFASNLNKWASENRVICTFLRFHPLLRNAEIFQPHLPILEIGPTAGWDLQKSSDLVDGMSKSHRKSYRRALRAGVEARVTANPSELDAFKKIYEKSMNRLSASSFYRFSDDYWNSMSQLLGESVVLVEAVFEGRVIAAVWCIKSDEFLHFHLSGTSDLGRELGAAVVCRVAAAQWGRDKGIAMAHFGGGVGGENSTLLNWKSRFDESLPLFEFQTAKIIHQDQIFSAVSAGYPDKEFFPPWRSPNTRIPDQQVQ